MPITPTSTPDNEQVRHAGFRPRSDFFSGRALTGDAPAGSGIGVADGRRMEASFRARPAAPFDPKKGSRGRRVPFAAAPCGGRFASDRSQPSCRRRRTRKLECPSVGIRGCLPSAGRSAAPAKACISIALQRVQIAAALGRRAATHVPLDAASARLRAVGTASRGRFSARGGVSPRCRSGRSGPENARRGTSFGHGRIDREEPC